MAQITAPKRQPPPVNEFGSKVKAHVRYVTSDGEYVPGVTTVLNELAKPALVPWANKLGLQGIDVNSYVDEAAQTGSLAHYLIQCAIRDEKPMLEDYTPAQCERAAHAREAFGEWIAGHRAETVLIEEPLVSDKYRFGGTVDWLVRLDDVLTLVDWKTSAAIYLEHMIQASAYVYLLKEHGHRVKAVRIIKIPRSENQGLEEHRLTGGQVVLLWRVFKNALAIYQTKREIKNALRGKV